MSPAINLFLPVGSRRRTWPRNVYSRLAAVIGRDSSVRPASHPTLPSEALAELEFSLRTNYFNRQPPGYLDTEEGSKDLTNHLTVRLQIARTQVIPWLESVRPLQRARVLEIGCGTGSSVVALAECGAEVIGVDLDEDTFKSRESGVNCTASVRNCIWGMRLT